MPRQPRLDAPGALHHVIGRDINGVKIFENRNDREDFIERLAGLCGAVEWGQIFPLDKSSCFGNIGAWQDP